MDFSLSGRIPVKTFIFHGCSRMKVNPIDTFSSGSGCECSSFSLSIRWVEITVFSEVLEAAFVREAMRSALRSQTVGLLWCTV